MHQPADADSGGRPFRGTVPLGPAPSYAADMDERATVMHIISGDAGLAALLVEVRGRLGDDPGHDLAHCLRVAFWTVRLGGGAIEPRRAVAAALLHDVVNVPKNSP